MMTRKRQQSSWASLFVILCCLGIAGSWLVLDVVPDEVDVRSADGGLVVQGAVPRSVKVEVTKDLAASDAAWTAVVGSVYAVSPDGVSLPAPVTLRLATEGRTEPLAVAWFDPQQQAWIPVETRRDDALRVAEASVTHFSHWALLRDEDVAIPTSVMDQLLEAAWQGRPEQAIGYQGSLSYATVEGDFVLLDAAVTQGQCTQTASGSKPADVRTSIERDVPLAIDGVTRTATLRLQMRWSVGSGCDVPADAPHSSTGTGAREVLY